MAVSVECVITVGQCDRIFDVDASWCGCYSPPLSPAGDRVSRFLKVSGGLHMMGRNFRLTGE